MGFKIPPAKAALLDEVTEALRAVPGVAALALGGSHARGTQTPESDLDIGLYYCQETPFSTENIREIARRYSPGADPTVTDFYEWGPFVNGGAWIANPVCKIDFLYGNLDQLDEIVATAQQGEWRHNFDQKPPFGFRTVTTLGEIHYCKPLHDAKKLLVPLKARVAHFPPTLKKTIVQDVLWAAEFSFVMARGFAESGDVPNTVGCMTRIFHYLVQALFALNEAYFMNDKRVLAEIKTFARKPHGFGATMTSVLSAPGSTPEALGISLEKLEAIFAETAKLADGTYRPKFTLP
jgi:hypothetical protein